MFSSPAMAAQIVIPTEYHRWLVGRLVFSPISLAPFANVERGHGNLRWRTGTGQASRTRHRHVSQPTTPSATKGVPSGFLWVRWKASTAVFVAASNVPEV